MTQKKSPKCGLIAKKWGPCFWMHMHLVAAGYPLKTSSVRQKAYMRYFVDLGQVLPCAKCRDHYNLIIAGYVKRNTYKNKFKSRRSLQLFIHDVHNAVNRRLKKPLANKNILSRYSLDSIENRYRAKC